MICVFDVIDGPARGKRFWMRSHQRLAVGRISTADFPVTADAHMSRHHLVLEANCEVLRLRDVGSANGTFVNEARINALELRAGDQIRAGSTIFELSILADHEDPHSKDGLTVCELGDGTVQKTANNVGAEPVVGTAESAYVPEPNPAPAQPAAPRPATIPIPTVATRVIRHEQSGPSQPAYQQPAPEPSHDEEVTMRMGVQWWMPHFQPTSIANLFEQVPGSAQSVTLFDIMRQLPASQPIALVANCSQLSKAAMETLYHSVDNRLIIPLSNALLLLRCDGSPAVWKFVQQSMRLDAITCLAAEKDFQKNWLRDLLDQLSYPSMMASLMKGGSQSLQKRLQEHVALAIFEKSRTGELGLYLNPRHR